MKRSLVDRRLVQAKDIEGEPCLTLHRSLQRSIRETAAKTSGKPQEIFDQALTLVRKVFPDSSAIQVPEPQKWREHQRLLPHVISLQTAFNEAKEAVQGSKTFARLLSDAGMNQWEQGFTRDGLLLLKTAEQVLDAISYKKNGIMRADINVVVALMYDNTGISTRAESLRRREQSLSIRTERIGNLREVSQTEEILLYNARMDYVVSLLQYNQYREAEPILEECLDKYREWGTPEAKPFEYAKYYHNMSFVRMYQKRWEEAIRMSRLGVQYMGMSGTVALTLRFEFDLACITLQSGDVDSAFELHKQVLEQRITVCGKTNENTLQSYYALGALHEIRAEFEEAE